MAECVITFLREKLTSFLNEENELLGGVDEKVEDMRAELERMAAFLVAAEAQEVTDPRLKVLVKQVRDVAYDTEDVLHEVIPLRTGRYRAKIRLCGFVHGVYLHISNFKARHQLASEMQSIKSRVTSLEGYQRYCFPLSISEQGPNTNYNSRTLGDCRGTVHWSKDPNPVGIEVPKQQLIKWLVGEDSGVKTLSVVGPAGIGKSTLVREVYDDATVKKHFYNHAWLTVSQPFDLDELMKDMLQTLCSGMRAQVPQGIEATKTNGLKRKISEVLQQQRYVLVFDNVRNIDAWEGIKSVLPNKSNSRVMLTTCFRHIASTSSMETEGNVYTMKPLYQEDSWTLFCKKAFRGSYCPRYLEEVSQRILKRCCGLPLAIVAIAGLLATKNQSRIEEWEMLHRCLGVELEGNDNLDCLRKIFSHSYYDLPYHLKLCLLYLSIFPEDYTIERMRLLRLWIAEGFVQGRAEMTLEEVAERYLNELVDKNLLHVREKTEDGRLQTCQVHNLWGELISFKSREQEMVTVARGRDTLWPKKVRHLAVHNSLESLPESKYFNRLRSVLIFGRIGSLHQPLRSLLSSGKLIKVLDFRGAPWESIPEEVFELHHLKYLSMRETKLKKLPKSIGKLQNLETLDLKGTDVTQLPLEITRLHKLRHLLVYRYKILVGYISYDSVRGFKAPPTVGGLHCLQKLSYIEADHIGGDTSDIMVRKVGCLTQLRKLNIVRVRRGHGTALCSSLENLTNLRSLNITSIEPDEILDLHHPLSSAPRYLQRLYLTGPLEHVPIWVASLNSLVRVVLRWSQLDADPLHSLQALPCLEELHLLRAYKGDRLCFKAGGFERLKILWLITLEGLRWVVMEQGAVPCLQKMYYQNCKLVDKLPSGIQHLTNLGLLHLTDMPDQLITSLENRKEGGGYAGISHIRDVWTENYRRGWRTGHWIK
ncbi:hypothetical protein RJ639_046007 [Escallonia herrerae]|uniref:Disease resistance protein RPM1-like n=1 Tax=Escallonia herrerae TaxID=1293975 RepID=A0AA88W7F9_9ASTE|nr:hypothetical protein RJ639_046007 [Escallonia herrerae]